ncbi:MAG: LemA family protein [Christensenellales bacterium]|jgi:LemA protein
MGWIIAGVIVLILIIWFVATYNKFIRLKNTIEEAFSTMDVYLKKRYDLIPNLVETVKGYAAHEKETLQNVVAARSMAQGATTLDEKLAGENMLTNTLRTLFAVAESYPDLKANVNFMDLQRQLSSLEDEIASSRKYYNAIVRQFNTSLQTFPSSIIASIFKFEKQPMFEINEQERENVKVQF